MSELYTGKPIAEKVLERVREKASALSAKGVTPGLATVLVGDDPASAVYVGQKIKRCETNGLRSIHVPLPGDITQDQLLAKIKELNEDPEVHAMIVQLPLPHSLNPDPILMAIDPAKDADGLHPVNQGQWMQMRRWSDVQASGIPLPCTPAGVMEILAHHKVSLSGAHAVVVGRSALVGKPLASMLLASDATVTLCHSRSQDLPALCREADVLIAAIGKPRFLTKDMVKPGAVVIDVGINRLDEGLVGDVDFDAIKDSVAGITPVPGGVGPMTVAMLLWNTVLAASRRHS